MVVRNPGPQFHRVSGIAFPVGEAVSVADEVGAFLVRSMGFEQVNAPKSVSEGPPASKPAPASAKKK